VALVERHGLPPGASERFGRLLTALAEEPDPPTTVRDPAAALDQHVADSLAGLEIPALRAASRIADVGSGAGFPGLALAIALPDARVDLIEAARRKCDLIERLALAGGASTTRAIAARAEDWAREKPPDGGRGDYDAVTARALAPLAVVLEYAAPLLRNDGALVAWKGARRGAEEGSASAAAEILGMAIEEVRRVQPFAGASHRHLHVYRKVRETPARFPRRPGAARKRPLA
jgi:16S rRNA (guanine527-N7)-methyltransferase